MSLPELWVLPTSVHVERAAPASQHQVYRCLGGVLQSAPAIVAAPGVEEMVGRSVGGGQPPEVGYEDLPRQRSDDTIVDEAMRHLEVAHRTVGLGTEDAVGGQPPTLGAELSLGSEHRVAAATRGDLDEQGRPRLDTYDAVGDEAVGGLEALERPLGHGTEDRVDGYRMAVVTQEVLDGADILAAAADLLDGPVARHFVPSVRLAPPTLND